MAVATDRTYEGGAYWEKASRSESLLVPLEIDYTTIRDQLLIPATSTLAARPNTSIGRLWVLCKTGLARSAGCSRR